MHNYNETNYRRKGTSRKVSTDLQKANIFCM